MHNEVGVGMIETRESHLSEATEVGRTSVVPSQQKWAWLTQRLQKQTLLPKRRESLKIPDDGEPHQQERLLKGARKGISTQELQGRGTQIEPRLPWSPGTWDARRECRLNKDLSVRLIQLMSSRKEITHVQGTAVEIVMCRRDASK